MKTLNVTLWKVEVLAYEGEVYVALPGDQKSADKCNNNNNFPPHCFSCVFQMKLFLLLRTDRTLKIPSPVFCEDSATSQAWAPGNSSALDCYFSGGTTNLVEPIFVSDKHYYTELHWNWYFKALFWIKHERHSSLQSVCVPAGSSRSCWAGG